MKKRTKILLWIGGIFTVLLITFFVGPVPEVPEYEAEMPRLPKDLAELQNFIRDFENGLPVRKDNQAHIVWADSLQPTEYSFLYLHGFAGSYRDGYPLNKMVAQRYGGNLYMARWAGHGLKPEAAMKNFDPEAAWESACAALAIAERLGKKVIILSTSTGGTLAIKLAAVFPDKVHAIINISPNIRDEFPGSTLLNTPWGSEIATLIFMGDTKKVEQKQDSAKLYWDTIYPVRALLDLEQLVESSMKPETYHQVHCPVLTLYYHKNFIKKDWRVDIDMYPEVHQQLGTPDSLKRLVELETPGTHFIGSSIKSKDYKTATRVVYAFCEEVLHMKADTSALPQQSFTENP